jgi:predicted permease
MQHFRYVVRLLLRSPGFTLVAVLSLGLGIGANTAIFSLMDAVLLRALPVSRPGQLYAAEVHRPTEVHDRFSFPVFQQARDAVRGQADLAAMSRIVPMQLSIGNEAAERVQVQLVSGEFFGVLGERTQIGRAIDPTDNLTLDGHPVAVISDSLWTRRFGRDPAAIGRTIVVNGGTLTVIGVTRPEFFGASIDARPDVWTPIMMQPTVRYAVNASIENGDSSRPWPPQAEVQWLTIVGRIADASAVPQVTERVHIVHQQDLARRYAGAPPERRERGLAQRVALAPASGGVGRVRTQATTPLIVLMGMVVLVLAVASANVAGLLLGRAAARQRELGIRLALGARRADLIRLLLVESVLLSTLGGVLGLLIAIWTVPALIAAAPGGAVPLGVPIAVDGRVLAFTVCVSLVTGLAFGLAPALRATRVELAGALAQTRAAGMARGRGGAWVTRLLVGGQMAFCVLLLVVAALFVRSLQQLARVDVGFDRDRLLVARLDLRAGYKAEELPALYRRLVDRMSSLPGVASASLSLNGPLSGSERISGMAVEGYTPSPGEEIRASEEVVTERYRETVGLTLLSGRWFGPEDLAPGRRVSIINETMAKRFFGKQEAVGRRWDYGSPIGPTPFEIIGVVKDARYRDLRSATPNLIYRPAGASTDFLTSLEVRAIDDPALLVSAVREALREVTPRTAVADIVPLDRRIAGRMSQERMIAWLTGTFSALALLLAAIGLYGTVAFAVSRRTSEIGLRMALGASRYAVLRMVLVEALLLVGTGLVVGIPLAMAAARALKTALFGIEATDPVSYLSAVALLVGIALMASALPARRASRIDPMVALRVE